MVEPLFGQHGQIGQLPAPDTSDEQNVAAASRTLALLNQEADAVRAQLLALREDLERVKWDMAATQGAQLLEANEKLVLAALRAQVIADSARRRLRALTQPVRVLPKESASGQLARGEYGTRIEDLREANEKLVLAALNSTQLEAQADQAHSQQVAFLAMAAHELRNPLLPLRLAAQMLTGSRTEEQLKKLQETINGQVTQMARLIGDLLDGSRISTGKFRLERRSVDLSAILDFTIETCEPAMEARHHRFKRLGPSGPLNVNGDQMRLVQVFSNLLENAAKYTPVGGEISLATAVLGDTVTITVSDNGIGITAPALPRVFELFVQDEHATTVHSGGLGIGLAVVRELVQAHGGSVMARSAGKDLGSQFVVSLPLIAPAATPD
jgi:signal transduction histidine kinase